LVRMEFIVANHIKVHPQALLYPERVKDEITKRSIEELTKGYKDKSRFFVDHLASGIGMIAAAFYPKPVILRFSDFKSNEYAGLLGGIGFEPKEENPMLGFRGASRYYSSYSDAFALECKAVKKIREEFGLTNLILMIPFCRTVEEAKKVVKEMETNQLYRTQENGLKIYGMCEIPSNVILAEDFLNIFDGYSIGSNDLTQLTIGVDRDSQTVSHLYDERNPAVKKLIASVIQICKKMNKYVGICGQAPSDYPDFTQFLIEQGIESISLNPDTVVSARILTSEKEKQLKIQHS
jgi:pyruvate, water dikinase